MTCLTDALVQAVVDNEASREAAEHAASCAACSARVRERRERYASLSSALDVPAAVPPALELRVRESVTQAATRGATRLRPEVKPARVWARTGWSAAALAGATLAVVFFVVPLFKGPATVSAAEILAKSANQLAAAATSGVELLEYELTLDGVPRQMMPDHADGTYRVSQAIDHRTAGRFRYSSFAPDGRLLSSIAHDPAGGTRVSLMRIDDQFYRFEFAVPAGGVPSLPEIERLHMQATVAMMQASGQQVLQTVQTADGSSYRVEVPRIETSGTSAVWDLAQAEVLIDAKDYRITQFSASGTFLKQPYSLSYRLLNRSVAASVQPDAFVVPHEPGEIVITGEGSINPMGDAFIAALKELAQARSAR
jgi:hypothetical protein